MAAPAERAWGLLQDIERVAGCMQGARITERIDERRYKGTVAVRFGPANLSFRGELELTAIDPAQRTLRLMGKGTDAGGGSGASLDLTARIDTVDATSCTLVGRSEVSLSGRAAAFGGRMADAVAEQVLRQFAANFSAELAAQATPDASAPAAAGETLPGSTPPAAERETARGAPRAARETALNGFALFRAIVRGWLRALFHWRRA
jgi:carbon monoxide dehydrogenase subunit G